MSEDRRNPSKPKKSKYWRKPLDLPGIKFKGNFYIGFEWPYTNSNGVTHTTTMTEHGWSCSCMGFTHYGKCKHIIAVHETMSNDLDDAKYCI